MNRRGLSQEGLKLIACVTMLIDHLGATLIYAAYLSYRNAGDYAAANALVPVYRTMRIIGRIAFPIYCFLLVEGVHHTRNPEKYGLRLAVGAVLSELPFDLAFSGGIDWENCNAMVTLLLGYGMILAMKRCSDWRKLLPIVPFFLLAEWLQTDYAGNGIAIIAMLALTKDQPQEKLLRTIGFACLLWFGSEISVWGVKVHTELFALVGWAFMLCYHGRKQSYSKTVQWAFYLFYPAHMLVLALLQKWIFG